MRTPVAYALAGGLLLVLIMLVLALHAASGQWISW